jgi:hypothetical protein
LEDGSDVEAAMPTASLKQTIEVNLFKNHMQELSLKVKANINVILGSEGDQIKACEYLVCNRSLLLLLLLLQLCGQLFPFLPMCGVVIWTKRLVGNV